MSPFFNHLLGTISPSSSLPSKYVYIELLSAFFHSVAIQNGWRKHPVDVRVEFESHANFPAETTAYCLIMHDRVVDYSPLSGDVNKRV